MWSNCQKTFPHRHSFTLLLRNVTYSCTKCPWVVNWMNSGTSARQLSAILSVARVYILYKFLACCAPCDLSTAGYITIWYNIAECYNSFWLIIVLEVLTANHTCQPHGDSHQTIPLKTCNINQQHRVARSLIKDIRPGNCSCYASLLLVMSSKKAVRYYQTAWSKLCVVSNWVSRW